MKTMAAKIAAEGGSLENFLRLWLDVYQTSTNKDCANNAEDHLRLVQAKWIFSARSTRPGML